MTLSLRTLPLRRFLSQTILGEAWRPEIFSNAPRPIVTILGDVVWQTEIFSNDPEPPIVTPGDRLAAPVADEQPEAMATEREARATNEAFAIEWLAGNQT